MSNMIKVFDLSNASDVSLTSTGFKKGDDTAKYVCKITDATIVFVGDNSKFNTDKKKQFNTISQHSLHHTAQGAIGRVQKNS